MPGHYGKMMKKKNGKKKVTGNRKKLDMDKDGKLTKKDFAMLRNKKKTKESIMRKGLYANIHAKRKRGGKMRKKGAKGAPTAANFKELQ